MTFPYFDMINDVLGLVKSEWASQMLPQLTPYIRLSSTKVKPIMLCCRGGSDTDRARSVSDPPRQQSMMGFTLVYVFYFHWLFCYVYLLRCSSVSHYNTTLHPVHFPSKTLHVDAWTDVSEKRQIQALLLILQLGTQTFCLFVVGFITFSVHLLSQRCAHARFRFVYKKTLGRVWKTSRFGRNDVFRPQRSWMA